MPHVSTYKTLFIGQLLDEKSSNNTFMSIPIKGAKIFSIYHLKTLFFSF